MIGLRAVAAVLATAGTVAALPAPPMTEGPPPGFTGGFGEPTCVSCHTGNDVNAFGGRVLIEGLPERYEPGAEYPLSVILEAEETVVAGFQITSRFAEGEARGRSAGSLRGVDGRAERSDSAGVTYLHQSRVGSATADPNGARWPIVWVAPESTEPVALNVAANSGNGDDSPLGDLVFMTEAQLNGSR